MLFCSLVRYWVDLCFCLLLRAGYIVGLLWLLSVVLFIVLVWLRYLIVYRCYLFLCILFDWICLLLRLFTLYCCVATRLLFVCLFELNCWIVDDLLDWFSGSFWVYCCNSVVFFVFICLLWCDGLCVYCLWAALLLFWFAYCCVYYGVLFVVCFG